MSKKRKVRADRIIIIVLASILVVGLLGFGISKLLGLIFSNPSNNNTTDKPIVNPEPIETSDGVKVTLASPDSYTVYISNNPEIDFNFIIAELKFVGNEAISFDLGNLRTSEKIYLNDVSKYLNKLNENGYKAEKLNVVSSVVSSEKEYTCKIFVPFKTNSYSLRILNSADATMIEFDLDKNKQDISSIKFDTDQQIVVGDTNVTVLSSYVERNMLHNGEPYPELGIYVFKIQVSNVEDNIMITEAKFVRDDSDEIIDALPADYESEKVANCIGKKLAEGDNGALFFRVLDGSAEPNYSGSLMLKFSNNLNEWVKIPTVLE